MLLPRHSPGPQHTPTPLAHPLRDLLEAVEFVLDRDQHLFTCGESHILANFIQMATSNVPLVYQAGCLYARLWPRKRTAFRSMSIGYDEVPDVFGAIGVLEERGFADDLRKSGTQQERTATHTVVSLRALCKELGISTAGPRHKLVERLSGQPGSAWIRTTGIRLRHQKLFRRAARLFLAKHSGDLSELVVERMGFVKWSTYTPTACPSPFLRRSELNSYEKGLQSRQLPETELLAELPCALARSQPCTDGQRSSDASWQFSGIRLALQQIERSAIFLKRKGQSQTAIHYFRYLLGREYRPLVMARQVLLCLETAHNTDGLRDTLGEFAPLTHSETSPQALALHRTCRRLARKVQIGWAPLATLRAPPARVLRLQPATFTANKTPRPMYTTPQGPRTIEQSVVAWLASVGRTAFIAENHLWSTIFGLLFRSQLFAPVPGALPTRRRSGPQDLYSTQFYAKRRTGIDRILGQIHAGQGPELLAAAHGRLLGEAIVGVNWKGHRANDLVDVVRHLGPQATSDLMLCFAKDYQAASVGLPDLVLLPGPKSKCPWLFPGHIPTGLCLVEIKGPNDSVQDNQRIAFDRLLSIGIPVELWSFAPAPASGG